MGWFTQVKQCRHFYYESYCSRAEHEIPSEPPAVKIKIQSERDEKMREKDISRNSK